jgi:TrmH family RNA methyltransferase
LPASLQHDHLCVVLVNTRNPLNIGAAARAMSNFGFSDLRLVNPYEASFREARSAVGGTGVLTSARVYKSVADAVADCVFVAATTSGARRDLQQPLELLEEGAKVISKQLRSGRVAILFGSEKRGLSNDDLSHCHLSLRIPTREEHGSMNLGQAVAVCLYELGRSGARAKTSKPSPSKAERTRATAGDLERITGLLIETLRLSGFTDARREGSSEEKIRRIVWRLDLTSADAANWLGMFRQILWKLKQDR